MEASGDSTAPAGADHAGSDPVPAAGTAPVASAHGTDPAAAAGDTGPLAPAHGTGSPVAGLVIGTEPATPLEFWVGVAGGTYLQLDDVVVVDRALPDGQRLRIAGVVSQVRARHEGARMDSDVFLVADGVLPAQVSETAQVLATQFEPEVFVPPLPGQEVHKATGAERDDALLFSQMRHRLPAGLSRDDEPFYLDLEFLDGTRGAHVNISGVSGVATKTSYATFLLYSLFHSGVLGAEAANTKALVFNVKGEDLLFLDHANTELGDDQPARYARLGLPAGPFESVAFFAPPVRDDPNASPDVAARQRDVTSFFWTIEQFCRDELLPFLFADAEDDRQQYTMVVHNVTARLRRAEGVGDGAASVDGEVVRTFDELVELIERKVDVDGPDLWGGRAMGVGTVNAFLRRLHGARPHLRHLVRADVPRPDAHRVDFDRAQVTVVDLHNLNDRAKRFVVGVVLRRTFERKERSGQARPLQFVVLDELNKYAPREGASPIKEILLDVAERGRSLGIVLIGAQQTASEVERRIVANSAIRVVGRLDAAEAGRGEYGFLPPVQRQRATIVKPGTMLVSQPELPIPLVVQFPFPAWATRAGEAAVAGGTTSRGTATADPTTAPAGAAPADPFAGFPQGG
ncbi:MAG TPA: ATP-binding protein [Acidimicrobiales bacterium]